MSAIRFLIIMQWKGMNNTNWMNQISPKIDNYCSDNHNINFIKESSVTVVLHKEEFESWERNSNLPTQSDNMAK